MGFELSKSSTFSVKLAKSCSIVGGVLGGIFSASVSRLASKNTSSSTSSILSRSPLSSRFSSRAKSLSEDGFLGGQTAYWLSSNEKINGFMTGGTGSSKKLLSVEDALVPDLGTVKSCSTTRSSSSGSI